MGGIRLRLLLTKNEDQVIFAEAGKEFVDFLMGLMEIPLGSILLLLKEKVPDGFSSSSLGTLYESIHSFDESYLQKSELINNVLNPKFAFDTGVKEAPFLKQMFPRGGSSSSSSCHDEIDGHVKGAVIYMVKDDLTISPSSTISGIELLSSHGLDTGTKETIVEVDDKKALELVRAAFQYEKVLTHVFGRAPGDKDGFGKSPAAGEANSKAEVTGGNVKVDKDRTHGNDENPKGKS